MFKKRRCNNTFSLYQWNKIFYEKPEIILDVAIKGLINIFDGCKKNLK